MVSRTGNSSSNLRPLGVMQKPRLAHPVGGDSAWERRPMKTGVVSSGIGAETAGGLRNVLGGELGTETGQFKGVRTPHSEWYSQV